MYSSMRSSVRVPARTLRLLGSLAAQLAIVGVVGIVGIVFASPAGAHTAPVPVELSPTVGAELDALPDEMVLTFDGDFTDELNVELIDGDDQTLPTTMTVDGRTVTLRLDDGVESEPGTYRLAWSVQTTHGQDSKDGIGAESRQVHFFVGAVADGTSLGTPPAAAGDDAGGDDTGGDDIPLAPIALGGLLAVVATIATVDATKIRIAVIALVVVAVGAVAVANSSDDAASTPQARSDATAMAGELPGGHVALLRDDGPWALEIIDSQGLATPWATAAQLRFTQPDHAASEIVDMTIDIDTLGRFRADVPEAVAGWDVELVLTSFDGPVVSFTVPTE